MKANSIYAALKQLADDSVRQLSYSLAEWNTAEPIAEFAKAEVVSLTLPVNHAQLPAPVAQFFHEKIQLPAQRIFRIKNAYVTWKAVVIKNLRIFVPALAAPYWRKYYSDVYLLQQWLNAEVAIGQGEEAVALVHDQWTRVNYYHWLVDALPRLLGLRAHCPGAVLVMLEPVPAYVQLTARLLGFERFVCVPEKRVLHAATLLVPEHIAPLGHHHPAQLRQLRTELIGQLFAGAPAPVPTRRVYVSRSRQSVRRLTNEAAVVAMLAEHGFECVHFEDLSFAEQVALMLETAVLVGVHGANLANLMFMQPGARVVELANEDRFLHPTDVDFENLIFCRMSSTFALPYYTVLGQSVGEHELSNRADLVVDPADLARVIRSIVAED